MKQLVSQIKYLESELELLFEKLEQAKKYNHSEIIQSIKELIDYVLNQYREAKKQIDIISDPTILMIINLKFTKFYSWNKIATLISPDKDGDSIRQYYNRFINKMFKC